MNPYSFSFLTILILVVILAIHIGSIKLYTNFCIHDGLYGYLISVFTVASPPCQFLNTIQFKFSEMYYTVWTGIAVSLCSFIFGLLNLFIRNIKHRDINNVLAVNNVPVDNNN